MAHISQRLHQHFIQCIGAHAARRPRKLFSERVGLPQCFSGMVTAQDGTRTVNKADQV
jgi:hypothetical protein